MFTNNPRTLDHMINDEIVEPTTQGWSVFRSSLIYVRPTRPVQTLDENVRCTMYMWNITHNLSTTVCLKHTTSQKPRVKRATQFRSFPTYKLDLTPIIWSGYYCPLICPHYLITNPVIWSGAAVPPWVGYNEEEKMMKQILSLSLVISFNSTWIIRFSMLNVTWSSQDERNVLRDPPAGVDFIFELESNMPVATAMLEIDPKLNDLRFKLVPKV